MMFGDRTDETEAARIVAASREAGLNAIDTADIYAGGESERITGRLIKPERDHWVLATKLANPTGPGPNDRGNSRRHVIAAVDASLQRLGTDWIDLLYLHRDDDSTPMEETLATLAQLIAGRQDPLLRRVELPRLAHRQDGRAVPRHGPAAAHRQPAAVQRHVAADRGGGVAGLRALRRRRGRLQPAGARRAQRQVPGRCAAARGFARRAQ